MSPAVTNFVFEAVNFLLLAGALGWFVFKPVRRALDAERARRASEEEALERLKAEAEVLSREARGAREAAAKEAEAQKTQILARAEAEAARIREEARLAQQAGRSALEAELASVREAQLASLADAVGRVAGDSVSHLLATLEAEPLDAALARAACAEIGRLNAGGRTGAVVECAHPLGDASRSMLEAALGGPFEERVVDELGAGVRITTRDGQVEASAASLAREAARAVTAAAAQVRSPEGADG